jgi:hypothetical protein
VQGTTLQAFEALWLLLAGRSILSETHLYTFDQHGHTVLAQLDALDGKGWQQEELQYNYSVGCRAQHCMLLNGWQQQPGIEPRAVWLRRSSNCCPMWSGALIRNT